MNWSSRIAYSELLPYSVAIVLAYLTGMVLAYVLARAFVFTRGSRAVASSALRFALVNVLAIVQTWGVSLALAGYVLPALGVTRYAQELAHAVGIAVPAFTSYLGHRRFTFREGEGSAAQGGESESAAAASRAASGDSAPSSESPAC